MIPVDAAEEVCIRAENDRAGERLDFEDLPDFRLFVEVKVHRDEVLVDEPGHARGVDCLFFELFAVGTPVCSEHHHDRLVLSDGDFAGFFQISLPLDPCG